MTDLVANNVSYLIEMIRQVADFNPSLHGVHMINVLHRVIEDFTPFYKYY